MASAQKMDKPQIDKFTNDTTFFTTTERIAGNKGSLSSSAENIEAYAGNARGSIQLRLKVELTTFDHYFYRIDAGNNVLFKLADNTILAFKNITDVHSRREGIGPRITGRECWTAEAGINLSKEDISKILASPVTIIRIQTDEQDLNFDVNKKENEVLVKILQLIVSAR
jgi:hypothetical protein